jgi:ferredoxin-NADP reductase
LSDPEGALPPGKAGQYLTIKVAGAGSPPPVRTYSLSGHPAIGSYRISIKREPNGLASSYLTTEIGPGAILEVAAPRGTFVLDAGSGPILLVSAGIGVTPVLSMLHQLVAEETARDVWWFHGARRPSEHALAGEARDLLGRLQRHHEHIFYSDASAEECRAALASPGRVTEEVLRDAGVPVDASAYVCGPKAFMAAVHDGLVAVGLEPSRIRTELFGALPSSTPGVVGEPIRAPHQPAGLPGTGPVVTFARSGLSVPFRDESSSILELAEACDVNTRWSCRTGVCHTCVTPLLSGAVEYEPEPLVRPDAGEVLICCSTPAADIVLDL